MAESKKNTFASIDAILAAKNLNEEELEVPEWGGSVKIRALSKAQQVAIRKRAVKGMKVDEQLMEGLLFITGVVEPKFEEHHIPDLFEGASGPFDRVLQRIMKVSGMTEEDLEVAEKDMKS